MTIHKRNNSYNEIVYDIPINDLKEHPDNSIFQASSQFIHSLAIDIMENNLEHPILVNKEGYIISGHKRRAACMILGWQTIPAIIRDIPLEKSLQKLITENTARQSVGPKTRIRIYEKRAPEFFTTAKISEAFIKELAGEIRIAESTVRKDLASIRKDVQQSITLQDVTKEWLRKNPRIRVNLVDQGSGKYLCSVNLQNQNIVSGPGTVQEVLWDSYQKARSAHWTRSLKYSEVGTKIRALRQKLGLTQSGLAGVLGISQSYLAEVEAGMYEAANHILKQVREYYEHSMVNR